MEKIKQLITTWGQWGFVGFCLILALGMPFGVGTILMVLAAVLAAPIAPIRKVWAAVLDMIPQEKKRLFRSKKKQAENRKANATKTKALAITMVFLFGLVESPKRKKLIRFTSANLLMLVLGASVLFVVVAETLMEMPLVQFVVENVFERDATLTGRTKIFKMFFEVIEGNWLDGYGYGNGNIVTTTLMGYANVQNALLQWVLQVGIMGTAGLVVVMYTVFRQIQRKRLRNMDMILPLVALIYMYIFLGSVETTFNMAFILWFGLIFMMVNERQPQLPVSETAVRARQ